MNTKSSRPSYIVKGNDDSEEERKSPIDVKNISNNVTIIFSETQKELHDIKKEFIQCNANSIFNIKECWASSTFLKEDFLKDVKSSYPPPSKSLVSSNFLSMFILLVVTTTITACSKLLEHR